MKNGPILVVEDDDDHRELMQLLLGLKGFEVKSVATLAEARQEIASGRYGLHIIDWIMPDGSGAELCRAIRAQDQATPIVLCSVRASVAEQAEGLRAGANTYLVKPYDTDLLVETVRRLLDTEPGSAEPRRCYEPPAKV